MCRMRKSSFPWVLAVILLIAFADWGVTGLILASLAAAGVYGASIRLHPRIRHAKCGGTGEHKSPLFPWRFRKCGGCQSGRLISWGAGQFGAPYIRAEYRAGRDARRVARKNRTWR